uniref:Stathmin n=1 Tax=Scleropages formosus TaxID=113540 RepID=A0A8C9SFE6_SCLFO
MTLTSYKEKMKELPLLSLFCSCLGREPQEKPREAEASADVVDLNWCVIRDMEVVEMNKRASGQAFEVILKPPSFDGGPETSISSPDYKNPSQEEVKDKPDVAEERRKCKEAELHSNRAEEGERKNEVTQRPVEENFVKVSRVEHEKNVEHLQEKEKHAEEVRTIEETQEDAVKHYFQIKCEDSVNLKTFKGWMDR